MFLAVKRMSMKSDLFFPVIPQFLEFFIHLWSLMESILSTPQLTFHSVAAITLLEEVRG